MDQRRREALERAVVRLADGDRDAFDEVYVAVWPLVRSFARRLVPTSDDAEDVEQTALLKVFERVHELDPRRPALPWILGIAAYEVKTLRKKAARRKEDRSATQKTERLVAPDRSVEEAMQSRELEDSVRDALSTLQPGDLETIRIAILEDERPAISAATFRKRLQRALARLRQAWRAMHGTD